MTPGRNEKCWCGSGLKYKKCHLDRDRQEPVNRYDRIAAQKAEFNAKLCLYPDSGSGGCQGRIVRAHSVRRSADLQSIARDGHVYRVSAAPEVLMQTGGRPAARLIGVNAASVFNGFCAKHDADTFSPLENARFTGSAEQCFLLFYRAWARELYTKEAAARSVPLYRDADRGRQPEEQVAMQSFVSAFAEGTIEGARDTRHFKVLLDRALLDRRFDTVRSTMVWFDRPFDVVCSGATYPYWDFRGETLQEYEKGRLLEPLSVTLLQADDGGCAVLSWLTGHDAAPTRFIESLKGEARVGDALVRFVLAALENSFARPAWWEALPKANQDDLVRRMFEYMLPFQPTPPHFLVDDGLQHVGWNVRDVTTP